jgi:hypothetical protein
MKTITPISIWDNGTVQEASVLNTYAINVTLNNSATFWWGLYSTVDGNIANQLSQGNLNMSGEAYAEWTIDEYAWDWVAEQLNLTITGDYVPPTTSTTTTLEPTTTTSTTTVVIK